FFCLACFFCRKTTNYCRQLQQSGTRIGGGNLRAVPQSRFSTRQAGEFSVIGWPQAIPLTALRHSNRTNQESECPTLPQKSSTQRLTKRQHWPLTLCCRSFRHSLNRQVLLLKPAISLYPAVSWQRSRNT